MMRFLLSLLLFLILAVSGLLAYIDYGPVSVLPILAYRHIAESDVKDPAYVHPKDFQDQMKYLADEKFNVISLDEVLRIYKEGGKIPTHTLAITFDGGYDDFNEFGVGSLEKYKFPATIFLQSGGIGKKGFMTKDQIKQLAQNERFTFGSNGISGRNVALMSGNDAYNEIFSSKTGLQKELEIPISYFSYPEGGFISSLKRLAKESNYKGACALTPGREYSNKDSFAMKRILITYADDNPIFFKLKTWGNFIVLKEWKEQRSKKQK